MPDGTPMGSGGPFAPTSREIGRDPGVMQYAPNRGRVYEVYLELELSFLTPCGGDGPRSQYAAATCAQGIELLGWTPRAF